MDKIILWLKNNNLHINISKTKYVQFGCKNTKKLDLNVHYENQKVAETDSITFLGLVIDEKCTWKKHIEKICSKINRFVYPLWRLPKIANQATALKAYHGYVASNLRYGIIMWGNSASLNKVFVTQKRCIRAICDVPPETSCKPLFKQLRLLTVPSLYIYETAIFVRTHMYLFEKKKDKINFMSRYPDKIWMPLCRTKLRSTNSYIMCIKIYNSIPEALKKLNLNIFKRQLHEWLTNKCFYSVKDLFVK